MYLRILTLRTVCVYKLDLSLSPSLALSLSLSLSLFNYSLSHLYLSYNYLVHGSDFAIGFKDRALKPRTCAINMNDS